MQYEVTYRKSNGKTTAEIFEAGSRMSLFAILKQRGISAIKINERPNLRRGYAIPPRVLFVVLLGIALLAATLVFVSPIIRSKADKISTENTQDVLVVTNTDQRTKVKHTIWKPSTTPVLTKGISDPPALETLDVLPRAHLINPKLCNDHNLFENEIDVMIADALTIKPGERYLDFTIDKNFINRFKETIKTPIPEHERDTEDDKQLKALVAQARQELKAMMDNGEDIAEFMQKHRDEMNKIADYSDQIHEFVNEMCETDSIEAVEEFMAESNKLLAEYGIPPMRLSDKRRQKMLQRAENQEKFESQQENDNL